jgi:hypothetical protein
MDLIDRFIHYFRHNNVFKDVYREVGILEVFVTCLNRYSEFLEKFLAQDSLDNNENSSIDIKLDPNETLGTHILEALTILLSGNNNNSSVFRESGGAKCVHEMVKFKHCRDTVLGEPTKN